jgi:hypothetical protein
MASTPKKAARKASKASKRVASGAALSAELQALLHVHHGVDVPQLGRVLRAQLNRRR